MRNSFSSRGGEQRQIDYSRIKNFIKATETSPATTVSIENGAGTEIATISDAALGFDTTNGGGVIFNTNMLGAGPLASGAWQTHERSDLLIMTLLQYNGSGTWNLAFGDVQNIHLGNGAGAVVGEDGSWGGPETVTEDWIPHSGAFRYVWKGTYGKKWEYALKDVGIDIEFIEGKIISGAADDTSWTGTGALVDQSNRYLVSLGGSATISLYGYIAVEFPNGFPLNLEERVNKTFTEWEAGNKIPFPVYTDD